MGSKIGNKQSMPLLEKVMHEQIFTYLFFRNPHSQPVGPLDQCLQLLLCLGMMIEIKSDMRMIPTRDDWNPTPCHFRRHGSIHRKSRDGAKLQKGSVGDFFRDKV